MISKKGQVSKVFAFVFSFIVVLFVIFLVVKFVGSFMSDSEQVYEQKFFEQIEQNYESVLKTYGSEKVYKYKVSSRVKLVCFVSDKDCIDSLDEVDDLFSGGQENMKVLFDSGDNVILFDDEDVLASNNIGVFTVEDDGCFCVAPGFANWFDILIENRRNVVMIDDIDN